LLHSCLSFPQFLSSCKICLLFRASAFASALLQPGVNRFRKDATKAQFITNNAGAKSRDQQLTLPVATQDSPPRDQLLPL
jgi:hypothetical protein